MNQPTDVPAPRTAAEPPPLAFIYDRQTSPTPGVVVARLANCELYAERQDWELAGHWIDHGDDALSMTARPQFEAMLALIRHHSAARPVVCLINDWRQLANEPHPLARFLYKVDQAGGKVVTSSGATDRGRLGMLATPATFRP